MPLIVQQLKFAELIFVVKCIAFTLSGRFLSCKKLFTISRSSGCTFLILGRCFFISASLFVARFIGDVCVRLAGGLVIFLLLTDLDLRLREQCQSGYPVCR